MFRLLRINSAISRAGHTPAYISHVLYNYIIFFNPYCCGERRIPMKVPMNARNVLKLRKDIYFKVLKKSYDFY